MKKATATTMTAKVRLDRKRRKLMPLTQKSKDSANDG